MSRLIVVFVASLLVGAFASVGQAQRVLLIMVDGLRPDAMQAASTPNIDALMANGTYSLNATTSDLTFSGPGQTDFGYGVHRDVHGATTNGTSDNPNEADPQFQIYSGSNMGTTPDLLAIANTANPALQTARFTGRWGPAHTTRSPAGSEYTYFNNSDSLAVLNAVSYYSNNGNNAQVAYLYLAEPDYAGHASGFHPSVEAYKDQITETDTQIGSVISAIQGRTNFASEDWVFILGSDHGGSINGGHSGNSAWQREAPLIVSGNSVSNGALGYDAKNVDAVATALMHLGIAAPSNLAGHAIGVAGTTDPRPAIALDTNLIFNGNAEYDHGFPSVSFDQAVTGWNEFPDADFIAETASYSGNDSATVIAYGSGGFPASGEGDNLFVSGGNVTATMTQTIDVSALAATIDSGINFQLDGLLGGGVGSDHADLSVEWLDGSSASVGAWSSSGPVGANGMILTRRGAVVPVGARTALVSLTTFGEGVYADELSLKITADDVVNTSTMSGDLDGDSDIDGDDWLLFAIGLGATSPNDSDLTGDGVSNQADFLRFKQLYEDFNGLGSFAQLVRQVPEPSTLALLAAGALLVTCVRNAR